MLGHIAGAVAQDFGADVDPDEWARKGGMAGGVTGLGTLLARWH